MANLNGKKILLGITGGIAAYKMCELIRMYKRAGADVTVVVTPNALNFVTKLTLQNLSQNNVYVEEFNIEDYKPEHISLADEADIFLQKYPLYNLNLVCLNKKCSFCHQI